ncbi:MAG: pilus assembly protein [Selenomonadaceae bacterium]|nr:pilus assembly protein [Selenomonadaceae bacterium]
MLKNFFRSHLLKLLNIRGQAMVFFALLIPLLFLFVGVGLDLGWYYLNVSRLQNAADAAALAGARTIISTNSGKLKDLKPMLVQHLPADNGLTDDGEPRVETEVETNTTTSENETAEGTTITYTETTTTTTTTISKTQLADLNWTAGDAAAKEYTVKNIGTTENDLIIDKWSLFKSPDEQKVDADLNLVKVNGDFYYIVKLDENIRHFFLPGWFDGMDAKVVAIAQLVPKDQVRIDTDVTNRTWEEFIAKVREIINDNVIVGNWEVQDKYKDISGGSYTITLKAGDYLIDSSGHVVVDEDGNPVINEVEGKKITLTRAGKFYLTFGSDYYTGAWNHFQDFYNHYYLGDLYRKQMVVVKDDVDYEADPNGLDTIDRNHTKGTIQSYGKGNYGESSSVAATSASINKDASSSGYNVQHDNALKTYQNGITERANVGYPFTWERLDSINIDLRPEVTLSGKWLSEDWDLELYDLDDFTGVAPNGNKSWTGSGSNGTNKIDDSKIKRLRIHTSMNFENPYKVRPDVDTEAEPDVLWARIESEPILNKPDVTDSSNLAGFNSIVSTANLNSVNQIILNFNQSNYNTNDQRYRPVIIFYDGPETYDNVLASYKAKPDIEQEPNNSAAVLHRKSKPVIVNLNESYRGILYAPNSPVVVIGDHKDDFKGFIVAKKYMELKDDDDFISAEEYLSNNNQSDLIYTYAYRYFNNANRQYEYTRGKENADGTVNYIDLGGTKVSGSVKKDTDAYRLKVYYDINEEETDPAKKKRYYKIYGKKAGATTSEIKAAAKSAANTYETINGMKYIKVIEENGIDMYVNDYGEIQFEDLPNPTKPWKCGVYDNFGRTDFTTYDYHVNETSADNMLLSGVKFDYEKEN